SAEMRDFESLHPWSHQSCSVEEECPQSAATLLAVGHFVVLHSVTPHLIHIHLFHSHLLRLHLFSAHAHLVCASNGRTAAGVPQARTCQYGCKRKPSNEPGHRLLLN